MLNQFHDFDPYEHLIQMSQKLTEVVNQHNRMAQAVDVMEMRILRLEKLNRDMVHKIRELTSKP